MTTLLAPLRAPCIVLAMLVEAACSSSATEDVAAQSSAQCQRDAAVYSALSDSLHRRTEHDMVIVTDSTVIADLPRLQRDPADSIAAALIDALARGSAVARPSATLELPFPVRIVSSAERDTILAREQFGAGRTGAIGVRAFPTFIYSFSPVAYTADGQNAIVYYVYTCARGNCGSGAAWWLVRGPNDVEWRVHRMIFALVS